MNNLEFCNNPIRQDVNILGETENIVCVKPKGHSGRCAASVSKLGDIPKFILKKIERLCMITMGNNNANSRVYNRVGKRWEIPFITKEEELNDPLVPASQSNTNKTHIRKVEWARAKDCQDVYKDMLNVVYNIYNGIEDESTKCPICKEQITKEELLISGSKDPQGLQGCHVEPLSEEEIKHRKGNFLLGHRYCNIIQSDNSFEEMFDKLKLILKNHGRI